MKGKPWNKRAWVLLISFLPLAFGFYAYMNAGLADGGYDVLSSLYSAARLYIIENDLTAESLQALRQYNGGALYLPTRICFEAGRWLALIVTASFIVQLLSQAIRALHTRIRAAAPATIALHGQESYTRLLAESIGKDAVVTDSDDRFIARRHIVSFASDQALYQYLNDHFWQLAPQAGKAAQRQVFLCATGTPRTGYQSSGFVISNMAENCARMYWNDRYLRHFGDRPESRIVLIGFQSYGQELLKQALLVNVFTPGRPPVRYDVFGDEAQFMGCWGGIANFVSINAESGGQDSVWFHPFRFETERNILQSADRILLAFDEEEGNLQALRLLLALGIDRRIHLRAASAELVRCLWPQLRITEAGDDADVCVFGTDRSLYRKSIVMDEGLLYAAQCIHLRYMQSAGDRPCAQCKKGNTPQTCLKTCEAFQTEWRNLGPFYQSSNIAQADHIPVKIRELLEQNCLASADSAHRAEQRYQSLERAGRLSPYLELEHVRWMRNQYLHGWTYDPVRDNTRKKHNLLVPFASLPENQQRKDQDAYDTLFTLYQSGALQ